MKNNIFIQFILISFLAVFVSGCKKEELAPVKEELAPVSTIGEIFEGGITIYLDETGQHGLVAALSDLSDAPWGCDSIGGTTSSLIGYGQVNTIAILNGCDGIETAASLCNDFVSGNYEDWYLPSLFELGQIFTYKNLINSTAIANGGDSLINEIYWSSSSLSDPDGWAWCYDFGYVCSGWDFSCHTFSEKENNNHVRAIRAF